MKRFLLAVCLFLLCAGAIFAQPNGWHNFRPITDETVWDAKYAYITTEGVTVYMVYVRVQGVGNGSCQWYFKKSENNGVTWSTPVPLFNDLGLQRLGGDYSPRAGIVKSGNGIHVVANIYRWFISNPDAIYYTCSTDEGATWSPTFTVSQTPPGNTPYDHPAIAVDGLGQVGVAWEEESGFGTNHLYFRLRN